MSGVYDTESLKKLIAETFAKKPSKKMMVRLEKASGLTMNEVIDRMAAAIYAEGDGSPDAFKTLIKEADVDGDKDAMILVASFRRKARKAHTAYLRALDTKQ